MDPLPHPQATTRLRHPDFADGSRDLLVARLRIEDPDHPDTDTRQALESAWQPNEGELRALANGAPILLCVIGQHPPVNLHVGEPREDCKPTYLASHIERAVGYLHAALENRLDEEANGPVYDNEIPEPAEFLRLWKEALQATINPPTLTIPDAPPEDLGNDHLRDDEPKD